MPFLALFGGLGPPELLIILAIVVVLFGATRIGDIGKGIGRGIREFRREIKEGQEEQAEKKEELPKVESRSQGPTYPSKPETGGDGKKYRQH